ncbi:DUF4124 domain-containing protein [Parahaliea maris]|uniref:DUF4124 domain-containing protein n=1 Tax=Parahaliea maris TaxID=2716870 RepID=A0A5C9A1B4_9GAMM|nr:DUF4124 domain-containing protein [Parahaliea maris]TXS93869.1 DUF4124 domain-containing protein [Parahaliea maris]
MIRASLAALTLALLSSGTLADSATVYKTVDEDGVVSFSDTPPAEGKTAETLEYSTANSAPDEAYQQRLEDMRETTDRMAADRREREKHRAELRRQSQLARDEALASNQNYDYNDYLGYPGGYAYPYPIYNNRPHHRPRPPRPPLAKPPTGVEALRRNLNNNSQLMRPMLPRREH